MSWIHNTELDKKKLKYLAEAGGDPVYCRRAGELLLIN
jgi:hypothetical protein